MRLASLHKKEGITFLGSKTLGIIIAALCLVLLIYLIVKIYGIASLNQKLNDAEDSLNKIVEKMEEAREEAESVEGEKVGEASLLVFEPKGWYVKSFFYDKRIEECKSGSCVCLCESKNCKDKERAVCKGIGSAKIMNRKGELVNMKISCNYFHGETPDAFLLSADPYELCSPMPLTIRYIEEEELKSGGRIATYKRFRFHKFDSNEFDVNNVFVSDTDYEMPKDFLLNFYNVRAVWDRTIEEIKAVLYNREGKRKDLPILEFKNEETKISDILFSEVQDYGSFGHNALNPFIILAILDEKYGLMTRVPERRSPWIEEESNMAFIKMKVFNDVYSLLGEEYKDYCKSPDFVKGVYVYDGEREHYEGFFRSAVRCLTGALKQGYVSEADKKEWLKKPWKQGDIRIDVTKNKAAATLYWYLYESESVQKNFGKMVDEARRIWKRYKLYTT